MTHDIGQYREEFRGCVKAMNMVDDDPDAEKYNELNDTLMTRVNEWTEQGTVNEVLFPLLDDEELPVRCHAAAYLVRLDSTQQKAFTVLTELARSDDLAVSTTAQDVIRVWRKGLT